MSRLYIPNVEVCKNCSACFVQDDFGTNTAVEELCKSCKRKSDFKVRIWAIVLIPFILYGCWAHLTEPDYNGMPPVIRLTALGMRGVPNSIKEAAVAFGASKWQLLKDVEIPLALPSIMTGVNQTILMCLSMVVIISLIGGGGLGKEILESLQYAAKGPGLLGGFAILFLAMVMDRIVQGAARRKDQ